jgi:hypothetical protein
MKMDIPLGLIIRSDTFITIEPSENNLGFYPTGEYLLVEITGRMSQSLYQTRKLITQYARQNDKDAVKPIAFRAVGQGINTAITLIHLMRTEEEDLYDDEMGFFTFSAKNPNRDKPQTGIQIILFPLKNKQSD